MATFVFIKSSNPISPCKIPNVPAFEAQPRPADQRDCSHRARSSQPRAEGKIVQIMQKRQYDKRMQAKFITEHAFHVYAGNTGDGEEIENEGGEIKWDAHRTVGLTAGAREKFRSKNREEQESTERHGHLAHFGRIFEEGKEQV